MTIMETVPMQLILHYKHGPIMRIQFHFVLMPGKTMTVDVPMKVVVAIGFCGGLPGDVNRVFVLGSIKT